MSHRLPAWQPARPPLFHTPAYPHYHIPPHLLCSTPLVDQGRLYFSPPPTLTAVIRKHIKDRSDNNIKKIKRKTSSKTRVRTRDPSVGASTPNHCATDPSL